MAEPPEWISGELFETVGISEAPVEQVSLSHIENRIAEDEK